MKCGRYLANFCVSMALLSSIAACRRAAESVVKDAESSLEPTSAASDQANAELAGWSGLLKQNESSYAKCQGQGGNARQLAPGFLESMGTCMAQDTSPAQELIHLVPDGALDKSGDCQFEHGISCHIHSSMEFVFSNRLRDDVQKVGELHCIVPSQNAEQPTVFGAHVRCAATAEQKTAESKECSNSMFKVFGKGLCQQGYRCCNSGTLTKPIDQQSVAEAKLRPNFRICQDDYVEVDCSMFHGMHEHTANVNGLGETYHGNFLPGQAH